MPHIMQLKCSVNIKHFNDFIIQSYASSILSYLTKKLKEDHVTHLSYKMLGPPKAIEVLNNYLNMSTHASSCY